LREECVDAIGDRRVLVVADRIERFTETGVALASGSDLEAELVSGVDMVPFGGIHVTVERQQRRRQGTLGTGVPTGAGTSSPSGGEGAMPVKYWITLPVPSDRCQAIIS
jgi:hypothetical protein